MQRIVIERLHQIVYGNTMLQFDTNTNIDASANEALKFDWSVLKVCAHQTTPSKCYVDVQKWACNPFCPSRCPSKRSKVPPINITVTVMESFGVNKPYGLVTCVTVSLFLRQLTFLHP